MSWFYDQSKKNGLLFDGMDRRLYGHASTKVDESEDNDGYEVLQVKPQVIYIC